jgi:hypothetical protein
LGDEACDQRLGQPWKILDENVSATVQPEQQVLDDLFLADDDLL